MATAKSTLTEEINDVQRRMAQIRRDLHAEVQEAVKGAQSWTDWRSLVRNHPWAALGAAAVVGYLIVPGRRSSAPLVVAVSPPTVAPAPAMAVADGPRAKPRTARVGNWSVLGTAFSLLAPIAVRAAQNYAIQYMEQWLVPQPGGPPESGPGGARPTTKITPTGRPRDTR